MIDLKGISITGTTLEITEALEVLFTTPQGTVPFDRNFGIDTSILDEPVNLAKGKLIVEFIRKSQLYEPRIKVKEVIYSANDDNNLIPKVRVE